MPANFFCSNCGKAFNTNQHLTQHKNRKKKCAPCIKDTDSGVASSVSNLSPQLYSTSIFSISNSEEANSSEIKNIISNLLVSNTSNTISIPHLIDFIVKHKAVVNENKLLHNQIQYLQNNSKSINIQNSILRKMYYLTKNFLIDYNKLNNDYEANIISDVTMDDSLMYMNGLIPMSPDN